jgi:hypothetical protein
MSDSNGARATRDETPGGATRWRGRRSPASFGLRAAVLAGMIAATAGGGVDTSGISDDPVRLVSGTGSTCCPPH